MICKVMNFAAWLSHGISRKVADLLESTLVLSHAMFRYKVVWLAPLCLPSVPAGKLGQGAGACPIASASAPQPRFPGGGPGRRSGTSPLCPDPATPLPQPSFTISLVSTVVNCLKLFKT